MGMRADRGTARSRGRVRDKVVRVWHAGASHFRGEWLTLEQAQTLLGDLKKVVGELEAEAIADREKARAKP